MTMKGKKRFWAKVLAFMLIASMMVSNMATSSYAATVDETPTPTETSTDGTVKPVVEEPKKEATEADVTTDDVEKDNPEKSETSMDESKKDEVIPPKKTEEEKKAEFSEDVNPDELNLDDALKTNVFDDRKNDSNAQSTKVKYAALDEFLMAVEAVGEVDTPEELLAAINNCLSIYDKLSPEDQKAQAEAYAYIVSYREQVAAGNPDEDIETLAGSTSYVMLHPTSGTTPIGVKVKVGDTINGYRIYQISGYDIYIDLGTYNVSMNSFQIPWPENVWKGVKTQYNPQTYVIAGTAGAVGKSPGASALLGNGGNTFYYYNLGSAASSGGDETVENPGGGGSNTENGSSGSYSWNAKIIYHANYPGVSNPPTWTTSYGGTQLTKGKSVDLKTYANCKFKCPKGYTVEWWYKDKNGTSKHNASNYFLNQTETFHLYAKYTKITTTYYGKVVYDANAGTDSVSGMPKGYSYSGEEEHPTYEISSAIPSRDDYEFIGWNTDKDAETALTGSISLNTSTTSPGPTTTLYAIWKLKDNGKGISITKTRTSINDDANKITAEPGDEIKWNIQVTNNSNVTKTIHLEELLTGVSLSKDNFTLGAGQSETITATYTVKRADDGKTIVNTVKASTDDPKEDKEASDDGTKIGDPVETVTVTWVDEDGTTILDGPKTFNKGETEPIYGGKAPTKAEDDGLYL